MASKKIILPKAYIICDQRRVRKDGTAPMRLIVKQGKVQKVYGLDIYLRLSDYEQIRQKHFSPNLSQTKRDDLENFKRKINGAEQKAKSILLEMSDFSFKDFEDKMFGSDNDTLFSSLQAKYEAMLREGRAGNATTYLSTLHVMRLFMGGTRIISGRTTVVMGGEDIKLVDINQDFLNKFEKWYLSQTKANGERYSPTTVGIYLRNIRVIMIEAVDKKIIQADKIPFGKNRYKIPGSKKRKLALRLEDIGKIENAQLEPGSVMEKYRDYFIFSYYAQGMNMADMARLRYEDIDSEKISYIRVKTAFKKREDPEFITVPLLPELGRIIDNWGSKPANPERYVFPILHDAMNPMQELGAIKAAIKGCNTYVKKIANVFDISGNISFYVARHSYATILKNSGISVQAISENLGHSSVKVTKDYLAGFDIEAKRQQAEYLRYKPA